MIISGNSKANSLVICFRCVEMNDVIKDLLRKGIDMNFCYLNKLLCLDKLDQYSHIALLIIVGL